MKKIIIASLNTAAAVLAGMRSAALRKKAAILNLFQDQPFCGGPAPCALTHCQRGAMFGMDARIALIVAAILTAAGGITYMSRLERGKVDAAEDGARKLHDALLKYYGEVSINKLPDSLETLFAANLVDDPSLRKDPWGNPWYYEHTAANVSIEGTPVTVQYAVIYSAGKDGVANSPGLSSDADYGQWEPLKDDVGVKVSTRDIELKRLEEYRARGQLIVDKLESAESSNYLEAQAACTGTTPPDWCEDSAGKNYTQFDYYPASNLDTVDGRISYALKVLAKPAYTSGDENDMQQLMVDLGLPPAYAHDPWGRTLQYNSNISGRADPPFSASICFAFAGDTCFNSTGVVDASSSSSGPAPGAASSSISSTTK